MKTIIFMIIIANSIGVMAYSCPNYIKLNPKAMKALEFMQKRQGQFMLGKCKVEVVVCEGWEETETTLPIAEVLVLDSLGREAYATIVYPQTETAYLSTKTEMNKYMIHYEKTDKFFEEEFGRTEALRLEMIAAGPSNFARIEMGLYSTHKKLNGPDGNESEWFICSDN